VVKNFRFTLYIGISKWLIYRIFIFASIEKTIMWNKNIFDFFKSKPWHMLSEET